MSNKAKRQSSRREPAKKNPNRFNPMAKVLSDGRYQSRVVADKKKESKKNGEA
jgi:hypothetical protein